MIIEWEVFTWIMGFVLGLVAILFWRYFDNTIKNLSIKLDDTEKRVDTMEQCHTETRVSMARIETSLEDIKSRQAEMQLDLKKIITKKK